jgi:hypothetical protein
MKLWAYFLFLSCGLNQGVWAQSQPDLVEMARKALAPPATLRLVPVSTPKLDGPAQKCQWRSQVLAGLVSSNPRVRLEQELPQGRRSWTVTFRKMVLGHAWKSSASLPVGHLLDTQDWHWEEVWNESGRVVAPAWDGQQRLRLKRAVAGGHLLRLCDVEAIPLCEAGGSIEIHSQGDGLTTVFRARALERVFAGRCVRIRLPDGTQSTAWVHRDDTIWTKPED